MSHDKPSTLFQFPIPEQLLTKVGANWIAGKRVWQMTQKQALMLMEMAALHGQKALTPEPTVADDSPTDLNTYTISHDVVVNGVGTHLKTHVNADTVFNAVSKLARQTEGEVRVLEVMATKIRREER